MIPDPWDDPEQAGQCGAENAYGCLNVPCAAQRSLAAKVARAVRTRIHRRRHDARRRVVVWVHHFLMAYNLDEVVSRVEAEERARDAKARQSFPARTPVPTTGAAAGGAAARERLLWRRVAAAAVAARVAALRRLQAPTLGRLASRLPPPTAPRCRLRLGAGQHRPAPPPAYEPTTPVSVRPATARRHRPPDEPVPEYGAGGGAGSSATTAAVLAAARWRRRARRRRTAGARQGTIAVAARSQPDR